MNRIMYRATEDISLEQLAEKYNTTINAISKLNNINGTIKKGMRVLVDIEKGDYYVVQPFDTIHTIAKKYSLNEEKIKEVNGIENVFIGQKIFLPES